MAGSPPEHAHRDERRGGCSVKTIGVMSPGDMGQAVAQQLQRAGFEVLTALEARSERTRALGRSAGLVDVGSVTRLVERADVVMSIMNPASALDFATEVAAAMQATGRRPLFLDCNALAPDSKRRVQQIIASAGARMLDVGIIGPPPRGAAAPRLYVSGPGAEEVLALATPQLLVRIAGERIGDAAAVKMCFAALGKGVQALAAQILVAADRYGVTDTVVAEYAATSPGVHAFAMQQLPAMPPKAYRWAPEMREIALTFGAVGLPPATYEGVAQMYEFIAQTALGRESPEAAAASGRTGEQVVAALSAGRGSA
jgi:3-hydroxyisobutyrate dehydrogenase-like beta-hydroxyacid dehydrogenase